MASKFLLILRWACVGVLFLPSATFAQTHALAIVDTPTGIQTSGKFIWADLVTGNAAKAVEFYAGLFGWEIEKVADNYYVASNNGTRVAGIAQHNGDAGDGSMTRWIPYISTSDPDKVAGLVSDNGGKIVREVSTIEGRGQYAVLGDPEGALFGVLKSAYGDPEDHISEIGEWVWQEVWASNPKELAEFYLDLGYKQLENWQSEDVSDDIVLEAGGFARGGIVSKTDSGQPSAWLPYIRISDIDASIEKTKELGGQVIIDSTDLVSAYPMAVVADASGGVFAMIEWAPEEENSK